MEVTPNIQVSESESQGEPETKSILTDINNNTIVKTDNLTTSDDTAVSANVATELSNSIIKRDLNPINKIEETNYLYQQVKLLNLKQTILKSLRYR